MQLTEREAALIRANEVFYEAFEALDLDRMKDVWSCGERDVCIHPGWEMLIGWSEIRDSWRAIFANTGYMRFRASDVKIRLSDEFGWVSCIENIFSVIDGHTIHSRVACTNLFLQADGRWQMILHHGSPIASAQAIQPMDVGEDSLN